MSSPLKVFLSNVCYVHEQVRFSRTPQLRSFLINQHKVGFIYIMQ